MRLSNCAASQVSMSHMTERLHSLSWLDHHPCWTTCAALLSSTVVAHGSSRSFQFFATLELRTPLQQPFLCLLLCVCRCKASKRVGDCRPVTRRRRQELHVDAWTSWGAQRKCHQLIQKYCSFHVFNIAVHAVCLRVPFSRMTQRLRQSLPHLWYVPVMDSLLFHVIRPVMGELTCRGSNCFVIQHLLELRHLGILISNL